GIRLAKKPFLRLEPPRHQGRRGSFSATLRGRGRYNEVDAPRYPRDHPEGNLRRRPHSRRAPAPYPPLRAGRAIRAWALGGKPQARNPERPRWRERREGPIT